MIPTLVVQALPDASLNSLAATLQAPEAWKEMILAAAPTLLASAAARHHALVNWLTFVAAAARMMTDVQYPLAGVPPHSHGIVAPTELPPYIDLLDHPKPPQRTICKDLFQI